MGDSEIFLTCFLTLFKPTCWSEGLFQWLCRVSFILNDLLMIVYSEKNELVFLCWEWEPGVTCVGFSPALPPLP